ncbi:MAG: putative Ig domain-containing protein, partial [Oscillatoria sp. PMC 1068.18]|nr:putative Ig domain-containing protein [Oscillatoria sp. PMC 1068.18]
DADGDTLTYTASGLPEGLSINQNTGIISGIPTIVGKNTVTVTADDGNGGSVETTFKLNVNELVTNTPPSVTTISNQNATSDSDYTLDISDNFSDADGDTLTYTASGLPEGLTINQNTGIISGIPTIVGKNTVTVTADDGNGGSVETTFKLNVNELVTNTPPSVTTISNQNTTSDTDFTFDISDNFSDADGDTLTYSASGLPEGLTLDVTTGVISGIPTTEGNNTVTVTADDGNGGSVETTFELNVANNNTPPIVVEDIADTQATEDTNFTFDISDNFSDADGDTLTYTASGLPDGLNIDQNSGIISGIPSNDAVGSNNVTVSVSDGEATVNDIFNLTVNNTNDVPTVTQIGDRQAKQGDLFSLDVSENFSDIDVGDSLIYSATNLPDGLTIDITTGVIQGIPTNNAVGVSQVTVTADDGNGGSVSQTFELNVANTNDAPILVEAIADSQVTENTFFTLDTSNYFNDIDSDTLTYTADNLPEGLTLDSNTGVISGIPTTIGNYEILVTADDGNETVSDTFELNVVADIPENNQSSLNFSPTNHLFQIIGDTEVSQIKFSLTDVNANNINEIGVYIVDDPQGKINGILPGENGYQEAALSRSQVIFSALPTATSPVLNSSRQLSFESGAYLGFYLVQNSTLDTVLADLKAGNTPANIFFASATNNLDNFDHLQVNSLAENTFSLAWEDLFGGGDADFNDLVMKVEMTTEAIKPETHYQGLPEAELIDLSDFNQPITAEFFISRHATLNNTFGLYEIDNLTGSIDNLNPGDEGYAEVAISRKLDLASPLPNQLIAPFLIADGTPEEFLAANPGNERGSMPMAYFAFMEANPDQIDHLRLLGNNTFAFEDMFGGGDFSYDDLVVQVDIA